MKITSVLLVLMLALVLILPCAADAPIPPTPAELPADFDDSAAPDEFFAGVDIDINYAEVLPDAPPIPEDFSTVSKEMLEHPLAPGVAADTTTIGAADGPTAILVSSEADGFGFHPENFVPNLYYMFVGMIGIFIVIGIIVLATMLLNKMFSDKAPKDE